MRVFITGGTGLVGGRLIPRLLERGDEVTVLTRQTNPQLSSACARVTGDPSTPGPWLEALARCDGVVHLAGENVFSRRWRASFKKRLYDSRIDSTKLIAAELARQPRRLDGSPKPFVCASAVGFYGPRGSEELDEQSAPGNDFLAGVCIDWERAAEPAGAAGARVSHIRIGMVLDNRGGALPKLARPFRWFVGGRIGSGKQWISWIHVADLVGLLLLALDRPDVSGPLNGTCPEPLTNWGFSKTLAKVLHRPCWLSVPRWALRIVLGEAAGVATAGQRVLPRRALQLGYEFQFVDLEAALRDLFGRPASRPGLLDLPAP